jgi:hypothetical protein
MFQITAKAYVIAPSAYTCHMQQIDLTHITMHYHEPIFVMTLQYHNSSPTSMLHSLNQSLLFQYFTPSSGANHVSTLHSTVYLSTLHLPNILIQHPTCSNWLLLPKRTLTYCSILISLYLMFSDMCGLPPPQSSTLLIFITSITFATSTI